MGGTLGRKTRKRIIANSKTTLELENKEKENISDMM